MKQIAMFTGIILFLISTAIGYGKLQGDVKNNKEKVEEVKSDIEKQMEKEREQTLKNAEIDTKQTVLIENLDRLIQQIERRLDK